MVRSPYQPAAARLLTAERELSQDLPLELTLTLLPTLTDAPLQPQQRLPSHRLSQPTVLLHRMYPAMAAIMVQSLYQPAAARLPTAAPVLSQDLQPALTLILLPILTDVLLRLRQQLHSLQL